MKASDLLRPLRRFPRAHVLVVGDIIGDHYIWGKVDRISPEAPVPVVHVTAESYRLGGAANVAHNIVSLGGRVTVCGVVGEDEAGRWLLKEMAVRGIRTAGVLVSAERPTTVKTRVIAHSQQVVRFDREVRETLPGAIRAKILEHALQAMPQVQAVVISDYSKGVVTRELVRRLARRAKGRGIPLAVDPKVSHFPYYRGVTLISPNTQEAAAATGIPIVDEESLLRAGRKLLRQTRSQAVLITRGEQGMSLFQGDHSVVHLPTAAREVYDVTGAGDTVIGVLALALAAGVPLPQAATLANLAAGIVVGEVGTATVDREQLRRQIRVAFSARASRNRKPGGPSQGAA